MIEWRQKTKPKKIPGPKFNLPKIPRRISEPLKFPEELHSQDTRGSDAGPITNVQIVLNTQKNPYLNQPTQKNTCQNFSTQKKPEIENFTPIKILQSSLSLEIWSTPTPPSPPPDGCPLHFRPSEQSGGKFVYNTNKRGHHSLSLILSEDHK